jgi:hypothetical protein
MGTINRQEHATRKSAPNCSNGRRRAIALSNQARDRRSLVQMRLTPTVIFNVVAGMIFLRQTPEMRSVKCALLHRAYGTKPHQSRPPYQVKCDYQVRMRWLASHVHRRFERSVKPPENSRAFTASRKWPPRRIRKPVLRRRSPVSSGVDDTGNLTFVHNLMTMPVGNARWVMLATRSRFSTF